MERLYALIAIIVCITVIWLLRRWNDNLYYPNKSTYRVIMGIWIGAFWILFIPAIGLGYIIHTCAYHFAEINWKSTFKDLWETIKGWFKHKK